MPAASRLPKTLEPRRAQPRPRLRAVAPPTRRRRTPSARAVAFYGLGMIAGFLLAGLASAPGGAGVVGWQLSLAAAAFAVTGLAAMRARAVARRARPAPARPVRL